MSDQEAAETTKRRRVDAEVAVTVDAGEAEAEGQSSDDGAGPAEPAVLPEGALKLPQVRIAGAEAMRVCCAGRP